MRLKRRLFAKFTAQVLIFVVLFNSLAMPLALAQEATDLTPTPTPEISPEPTSTLEPLPTETPTGTSTETPTETPAVTETPSLSLPAEALAKEGDPSPTPTPQSTITTGDADSSTSTDITVNKTEDEVSAENPPENCPSDGDQTDCNNLPTPTIQKQADVDNTATSSAITGENVSSGADGGASIDTGDARATSENNNDINSSTTLVDGLVLVTPTVTETPALTPTPTIEPQQNVGGLNIPGPDCPLSSSGSPGPPDPSPTPTPVTLVIENAGEGNLKNDVAVSSITGNNVAGENLGEVDITTGDGLAWANLLNLLNTNIVGSNFEILFLDIRKENMDEFKEIDLNEIWKKLDTASEISSLVLGGGEKFADVRLTVRNYNIAGLENKVNVCVLTGENKANNNENAQITTGDGTALANVNNFVNTNIIGSKFFFGVINILDPFSGNIILPRPESFNSPEGPENGQQAAVNNNGEAIIENILNSEASTGLNQANNNGGDNLIKTGSAEAISNSFTLANLNYWKSNWFFFWLNSFNNWDGQVLGWENPASAEKSGLETQAFEKGNQQAEGQDETEDIVGEDDSVALLSVNNNNIAEIKNEINAIVKTGNNHADGNIEGTDIQTGDARSIANLMNFVNLNIVGSRWFMGLVNVMAKWSGNTIFAYPDLITTLSADKDQVNAGDLLQYTLTYKNQGYDEAQNATIKFELPRGIIYVDDNSGMQAECNRQICFWSVGNLARGAGGSFVINTKVDSDFWSLKETSFWKKLVKEVFAADNAKEVVSKAFIAGLDPEPDVNNNESVKITEVKMPAVGGIDFPQTSEVDQRQPVLEISASNNVAEYVYSDDTVTFEITIRNKGEVTVTDAKFVQDLYNGIPGEFGKTEIFLGDIGPGKGGKLTFGVKLDPSLIHAGEYHTVAKVFGYAPNGNEVVSNETRTEFNVRIKTISARVQPAVAVDDKRGVVLAEKTCETKDNILPYVLLLILSSWSLIEKSKRFLAKEEKEENEK